MRCNHRLAFRTRCARAALCAAAAICVLAALAGCRRSESPNATSSPPPVGGANLLLITLDTTRADHLGCYGNAAAETPNLDALAQRGVRFERCVTAVPITLPAHACIMTGTYPFYNGVRDNGRFRLHSGNVTLAEVLARAGYVTAAETAAVVLNHDTGIDQGFDVYHCVGAAGDGETPTTAPHALGQTSERAADAVADAAIAWLKANDSQKFFLWVHFFDPHYPYAPPAPYASKFENPYDGEIAFMDAQIGRVLAALKETGQAENTLVVAVGDHGEGLGDHDEDNHTFFNYDTTMHVPLIVAGPGIAGGRTVAAAVRTVDVLPTILDLLGLADRGPANLNGESVAAVIKDASASAPALEGYGETMRPFYVFGFAWTRCLWADGFKYIHAPAPELYDLKDDPGETKNLAMFETQRVADMRKRLRAIIADTEPPVWAGQSHRGLSDAERSQLESLGYAMNDDDGGDAMAEELALFEPRGAEVKSDPEIVRLWSFASVAWQAGQYGPAADLYSRLVEAAPQQTTFQIRLALCHERLGDRALAMKELKQLLTREPDNAAALAELNRIMIAAGENE